MDKGCQALKFEFNDILENRIYENTYVMLITGPYNIFNNMVADELKRRTLSSDIQPLSSETLEMFGFSAVESGETEVASTSIDFDTFFEVVNVANLNGRWFCRTSYDTLSSKQKEKLFNYFKNPNSNGILVIDIHEYRDYARLLRNGLLATSRYVHIIQLSWPTSRLLTEIVAGIFKERRIVIDKKCVRTFIMRLGRSYDDYLETADRVCLGLPEGYEMENSEMVERLKRTNKFVVEDFIEMIVKPLKNDKTNSKKVYHMMGYLIDEFGARGLAKRILRIAEEAIEIRQFINEGYIPITVNYSYPEVVKAIGDKSKISKLTVYQFRKRAELASRTSLKDWEYIILILSNINGRSSNSEYNYARALYSLVVRSTLGEDRLNNDIGISNVLTYRVSELDKIRYVDRVKGENETCKKETLSQS